MKERQQPPPRPADDGIEITDGPFDRLLDLASEIETRSRHDDTTHPHPIARHAPVSPATTEAPAPVPAPPRPAPPKSLATLPAPPDERSRLRELPPPPRSSVLSRPSWMPSEPLLPRSTMATVLLAVAAVTLFVLATVLIVRGDEIAQRVLNGPRRTPTMTDEAISPDPGGGPTPVDSVPPTSAATPTSAPAAPQTVPTDAGPAPTAPPATDPCTAQSYWEGSRPADLAAMTVTGARCVGSYGLVSLAQPEATPDAEPPQLFIALRTIGQGWGIIATQTQLDCGALQQVDPQVPGELCG